MENGVLSVIMAGTRRMPMWFANSLVTQQQMPPRAAHSSEKALDSLCWMRCHVKGMKKGWKCVSMDHGRMLVTAATPAKMQESFAQVGFYFQIALYRPIIN